MSRAAAVRHAIHEMELSGFVFTPAELETWDKIARGELPFEYVRRSCATSCRDAKTLSGKI